MQLKIGTKNFDRFTKIPIPLTVKFYFFNVTNSEQVLAGLERPHFEEVGPFVYEQWRRRSIVDILDNNRKITYREYKTFYSMWPRPVPRHANESLASAAAAEPRARPLAGTNVSMLNPYAHNVTIVNLPLLSMLTKLADWDEHSIKRSLAAKVLTRLLSEGNEKMLVTKPVNELLFDGYKVGVLEAAKELLSGTLNFNFESPLPRNKFGFFHTKNNTWSRDEAGELTIYTGRNESMDDFMLVDTWNGLRRLNTWPKDTDAGDRCNQIRGTDGSQFHPGVTRDQALAIFSPMICTSIQVAYREDTACRDIPLLRFTTTAQMFAAPKKRPQTNGCYCTIKQSSRDSQPLSKGAGGGANVTAGAHLRQRALAGGKAKITDSRCYIDGLIDLSLCQRGAPVAASGPHFYNGDPLLAHAAGLKPRKEVHETYMDIEPMTGAVMRAASRAQLNAFVEQAALEVVEPQLIGSMTPMVAPLLWLEEAAEIDEKSAAEFRRQLLTTVERARRSFFYAIGAGLILALVVPAQYWYVTCYRIDAELAAGKGAAGASARKRRREVRSGLRGRRRPTEGGNFPGARHSNLVNLSLKRPLVKLEASDDEATSRMAKAAGAVAAVLGAADASVTANQRRAGRQKRSHAHADAGTDHEHDDELSRRGLVANEWSDDRATTGNSSSGELSEGTHQPEASTSARTVEPALDEDGEPAASRPSDSRSDSN